MASPPLVETTAGLRLSVDEILADHSACVAWDRARRATIGCLPANAKHRKARIARLLAPHKDVMDAAHACVSGKGHH